jgi:hypothetical protein
MRPRRSSRVAASAVSSSRGGPRSRRLSRSCSLQSAALVGDRPQRRADGAPRDEGAEQQDDQAQRHGPDAGDPLAVLVRLQRRADDHGAHLPPVRRRHRGRAQAGALAEVLLGDRARARKPVSRLLQVGGRDRALDRPAAAIGPAQPVERDVVDGAEAHRAPARVDRGELRVGALAQER